MLRVLVLGIWLGAMIGFAFLFAPAAFAHVGPTPAFAATIATSVGLLTRLGDWCGIVAAAITVFAYLERRRVAAIIVACITLAMAFGFAEMQWVVPQMQSTPLRTAAYDALHQRSSAMYAIIVLAVVAAFALSAWRPQTRS
ncbi:MAG: hypothetical protein ACYDGM_10380 [Vulcanimicrobiaceae bacterium]